MDQARPNPDELLARVLAEEPGLRRGKLKIFFGYAAGVGKTYAMLTAARREQAAGVDVMVGYVEPHGRLETESLLQGLPAIAPLQVSYRGVTLQEFDLDAALARRPRLILVDELAHTNAEGLRHAKRWQDVEELLAAGIDVWSTLNVQHIESLNDIIAQITHVVVRETLPDAVLERAHEIELIDLTPEELMLRLQAGKVYLPSQAERALTSFFQRSNLVALRELSLRQTAHRLHQEVEAARQARADFTPWATREKLLVCVGPSPSSTKIIRTAKRMAVAFGGDWLAVAVNTGTGTELSAAHESSARNLQFAERLGAESQMLIGQNVADTVLKFARDRNVTKIIAGKTAQPKWKRWFRRTVVEELLTRSGEIDVYVITGEGTERRQRHPKPLPKMSAPTRHYLATFVVVAVCALVGWANRALHLATTFGAGGEANIAMVFLAGVAFVATWYGRGPAIAASIVSVLLFDFFFVPPYGTFTVTDTEYLITFAVMLGIALLISTLAARQRSQLRLSQEQENRTAKLFRMTRQLSELSGTDFLLQAAGQQLKDFFGGESVVYLRAADGALALRSGQATSIAANPINDTVARWVADNNQIAGVETDTLPNATALFMPLVGSLRTIGALGVRPDNLQSLRNPQQRRLLETCASLIALAIERDQSVLEAQDAQVQMRAEQLRNSLLSSVSHDLRTPLTAIAGTAANLKAELLNQTTSHQQEMLQTLVSESHQLVRLVENLLDMARLESGSLVLNRQWHVLEELVGSAIARSRRELGDRRVHVSLPEAFPLILVDGFLLEQVFVNLLENAARYTPPASALEIWGKFSDRQAEIVFADDGPGLPPGSENRLFEKFYRPHTVPADGRRGIGLGLAICRGIVEAHGGRISASNRATGGAQFTITLPCKPQPADTIVTPAGASASP
ncbi:MAG TPA: sensor histidine kinase KdpD [Pirellulales bacterium]|jgi:two-component system sensor histidine kinase KdpD|nr:sensor histidine kinase KdpD [Pirellulales bacterium]